VSDALEQIRNLRVPADNLRRACPPRTIDAQRNDGKFDAVACLGQQRAVESLRFGFGLDREGYNIFVLGPLGSYRHQLVEELARERARERRAPDDWCYVNNFSDPEQPRALRLPAGKGTEFRNEMRSLIEELQLAIPAAFEDDDYRNQLKTLEGESQKEIQEQWQSLKKNAEKHGITVLQTPTGYVLAPVSEDKVIDDEEFKKLPEEERKRIQAAIERLSSELQERIERMPRLRKRYHERIRELDQEVTAHVVSALIEDLKQKYSDLPNVLAYLDDAQQDITENAREFREEEGPVLPFLSHDSSALFASYQVNVMVSNDAGASAPFVYEANPSYSNLIGKVEHRAEMGALFTDFRMVRAGALLQANGGYLVLDAHRVLARPFVWEALKLALFAKKVRIESAAETLGFVSTASIKPEPIPLDIKIVLIGERWLFYLMSTLDREFNSLFKVAADFDDEVERSMDNVRAYSRLITHRIEEIGLLPFSEAAIQKVIEERARHAGDSERLSTHIQSLDDLLVQADFWARQHKAGRVDVSEIVEAVERREYRFSRAQTRILDAIQRDTLLIDTSGEATGQVNGLSVIQLGDHRFGHPVRITAITRIGSGNVVDIEREVELGGAIHSKGVMILAAALSARFAPDTPLSLHGSIVFEQSYGGVEGDSASVAELCALLSSISDVPIKQGIACTGSVNQLGRIQVVGGVNEKIEGFFETCRQRGLDGSHGVIIPADNVKHLMLREEIIEAVNAKRFTVYAVRHIDEAVSILTGQEAGQRETDGAFQEGTVNRKVEDQLILYAKQRRRFAESPGGNE
jgi:lon-related putative ATP-dependent protease